MKLLLVPSLLVTASACLCAQSFADNLDVGTGVAGNAAAIELGINRTADGSASLDFHSSNAATTIYANYGLRISRTAGDNGMASFVNHGSGGVQVGGLDTNGSLALLTAGLPRVTISNIGDATLSRADGNTTLYIQNLGVAGGSSSRSPRLSIQNYSSGVSSGTPVVEMVSAQGIYGAPAPVAVNQDLGALVFRGYNGASNVIGCRIICEADSAWSDTSNSAHFEIRTATAGNDVERIRITADGKVGIGTPSPAALLEVAGDAKATTLTTTQVSCSTAAGIDRGIALMTGTKNRWSVGADNAAETGSLSTGSDFFIRRHNDAGAVADTPISIKRTSGVIDIGAAAAGHLRVLASGQVVIGGASVFQVYTGAVLSVNGTAAAKEVIVSPSGWSDYVFDQGYQLMPLSEVEKHVTEQHHLPGVPSAAEVARDGVAIGDMQSLHLKKIEELTLYAIAADKRVAQAEAQVTVATAAIAETTAKLAEQQRQIDELKRLVTALAGGRQAAQP